MMCMIKKHSNFNRHMEIKKTKNNLDTKISHYETKWHLQHKWTHTASKENRLHRDIKNTYWNDYNIRKSWCRSNFCVHPFCIFTWKIWSRHGISLMNFGHIIKNENIIWFNWILFFCFCFHREKTTDLSSHYCQPSIHSIVSI